MHLKRGLRTSAQRAFQLSSWEHLEWVRVKRNVFAHGDPSAIDDALVEAVVENLKTDHESWIAIFNLCVSLTS